MAVIGIREDVGYLHYRAVQDRTRRRRGPPRRDRISCQEYLRRGLIAMLGGEMHEAAFVTKNITELRLAKPSRALRDHVEHRLRIGRRSGDDLENACSRGLTLQQLDQVVRSLAQCVQQPSVLDGDDSLRGEILDQFDLFVGKWPDFGAIDDDDADQFVFFQYRHHY